MGFGIFKGPQYITALLEIVRIEKLLFALKLESGLITEVPPELS